MLTINQKDITIELDNQKSFLKTHVSSYSDGRRAAFAKSFCFSVVNLYWDSLLKPHQKTWRIFPFEQNLNLKFSTEVSKVAFDLASLLALTSKEEAADFIGALYSSLLPDSTRSEFGVYYTPTVLVNRLIHLVSGTNFSWTNKKILDPACGGAAFLAPLADKINIECVKQGISDPKKILKLIEANLTGLEIDDFAAWISQVLVEIRLLEMCLKSNHRIKSLIKVANTLELNPGELKGVDLVIGNPPYGKVKATQKIKDRFANSIYGHPNLYALFTDFGLQATNDKGIIAYVTPTSFLGGQYFKGLRKILSDKSHCSAIEFIDKRTKIFEDVLQETSLTVFDKSRKGGATSVNSLDLSAKGKNLVVEEIGKISFSETSGKPWLIPRTKLQMTVLQSALKMSYTLEDYGFEVNTGQMVWNRHKEQLQSRKTKSSLPIIWSESVLSTNEFEFRHLRKNHEPYFSIEENQKYLITNTECIIVQRTTAKEQNKRLIAAILPKSFINKHGGAVIENHVNVIKPTTKSLVSLKVLLAVLTSDALDQVFRCISGSVAVSAYELNSIPLPNPEEMGELEDLIKANNKSLINLHINNLYSK
jgi:adenine-specific DNA-methyltransferase